MLWLALACGGAGAAQAAAVELIEAQAERGEDGLWLTFTAKFELPRPVEEAVLKGIPIHFVAEAEVFRSRWYWTDKRVAQATRSWRLMYQPLTRRYRVTFGSLSQSYESLYDALSAIQRTARWRVADAAQVADSAKHYVEYRFRLDISLLPRPFQFGIGGQPEWDLAADDSMPISEAAK